MKIKALLLSLILVVSMPANAFFTTGLINAVTDFFPKIWVYLFHSSSQKLINHSNNDGRTEPFEVWKARMIKEAEEKEVNSSANKDIERSKRLAHPIGNMPITPQ